MLIAVALIKRKVCFNVAICCMIIDYLWTMIFFNLFLNLLSFSVKYFTWTSIFSLGVEKITESYKSLNLKVKHYSGRELSEQLSAKFEKFFDEKVYALRNLTQVR